MKYCIKFHGCPWRTNILDKAVCKSPDECDLALEHYNLAADPWPNDMAGRIVGVTLATPGTLPPIDIKPEIKARVCRRYRLFPFAKISEAIIACHDTLENAKDGAQQIAEKHHTNVDVCMVIGTYKSSVVYEEQ